MRKGVTDGSEFFLITSKDYDRDIDILHTKDQNFNASFKCSIEPGLLEAYDVMIIEDENKKKFLRTLIKIGDYLYQHTIDIDKGYHCKKLEAVTSLTVQRYYSGYGFNWPYFSYATKNRKVLILNCFNPNFVMRFIFPDHLTTVV